MIVIGPVRWWSAAERWWFALFLGAAVGFVVLGIGGRIAMRAIASANRVPTGFSVGGTATVVLLGVASGVGGGFLYAFLYRYVQRPRLARSALFTLALVLLTLRGLRPIQPLALEWFLPLALGYGAIVDVLYTRWAGRRTAGIVSESPTSSYPGGA
jgi:hypothetical protein